jgi:periplasmic protein TonB
MPHALLLSPDDQAVSAITAVLEEMSVTCERPLDGPSAAKKLNAQSFDLVLVDCENLPAAKLIFDVCRRSQTGTNPVPIAIVDGRAGLPTAFRLGAELILTKPVAKDQARTTIRTAVSRVRKDEPARTIHPFEEPHAETATPAVGETLTHAAAAGATSSPASSESASVSSTRAATARMSSAAEEIATVPAVSKAQPASMNTMSPGSGIPATDMFMPTAKAAAKASDDPVLADLESDLPTPVFSSYVEPKKKVRGSMVALLLLVLAGGGFYAAWMYQPGFRQIAQPQVDRLIGMIGGLITPQQTASPRPAPAPTPVKATPQPAPPTTAPASDATASPEATNTPSPTTPSSTPASTNSTAAAAPLAVPSTTATATATLPDTAKLPGPAESEKSAAATASSDAELPGEKTAVILSSQGAEKRLLRHVQPAYPAQARKSGIEGTVVLKTVVSETGAVEGVRLVEGNPALATAAIGSVKQWRYRPYVRNGKARPFQTIVLVEFQRP